LLLDYHFGRVSGVWTLGDQNFRVPVKSDFLTPITTTNITLRLGERDVLQVAQI